MEPFNMILCVGVHLTDAAGAPGDLPDRDLDDCIAASGGIGECLDLLPFLNDEGCRYNSLPDLTDNLDKARALRRRVQDDMENTIERPPPRGYPLIVAGP